MEHLTPEKFEKLKNDFYLIKVKYELEILDAFTTRFYSFRMQYNFIKSLLDEIDLKEAFKFNIFNLFGIGHLEVSTHTTFLAELLDPKGSHAQKTIFLKQFLLFLGFSEIEANDNDWKVWKELDFIDIQICNFKLKKAVFIENKIYTQSHTGQISRYFEIWKNNFKNGGRFIYLTIYGNRPNDEGFNVKYPRIEIEKELICISYKQDIKNWLETMTPLIQATRVREIVYQYIELLGNYL